jgi:phage shock protein PspC (stress-responsive transcriptional regulator)
MNNYRPLVRGPLLLGVCSSLGRRSGIPVVLVRIAALLLLCKFGFLATTIGYFACAIVIPPH